MPGKKDRKRDRGGGGGAMGGLGMFGVPEMPAVTDDDLEAELLALTGGKSAKKGNKKSKGGDANMSMADIDKMLASVKNIGEEDDDGGEEPLSDMDDDDLLAELQDLQEDDDDEDDMPPPPTTTKPVKPVPAPRQQKPHPSPSTASSSGGGGGGDHQVVQSRLQMYESAIAAAKSKGESSKVRRYERGLKTLQEMSRSLKAGKKVNVDDLPPEVLVSGGGGGGSSGVLPTTAPPSGRKEEEDDMAELKSWVSSEASTNNPPSSQPSAPASAPVKLPSSSDIHVATIQERLKLYEDGLKAAESQGDSSKARRYKRSISSIQDMLKAARAGKHVNTEELPPVISIAQSAKPPVAANQPPPPPTTTSSATNQSTQSRPGNMIDLDAPEFDEFNLSEEDMASMLGSFVDDRSNDAALPPPPPTKATPTKEPPKPTPKPRPQPSSSSSSSSRPPGLIDLDTPEFAEFDLSDADLEALASQFVDDRKKEATSAPPPASTQSLPSRPQEQPKQQLELTKKLVLEVLAERKEQYMKALQRARDRGDEKARKQYGLVAVNFKRAIDSVTSDAPVDLRGIPPPPPGFSSKYNVNISSYGANKGPHPSPSPQSSVSSRPQQQPPPPSDEDNEPAVDSSIPVPKTPLEALNQRLDKYKEGLKSAQEKGESSRVRRTGRIIKQYEDAIKMTKAGKACDFSELPTPPGFPPIPTGGSKPMVGGGATKPVSGGVGGARQQPQSAPSQSLPASVPARLHPSVSDRQLQTIQQRAAEFLTVVKQAKAKGDKDKAVTYLRYYKSIQQMQQAAQGGLPVDLTQLPPSPFADPTKATVSKSVLSHLGPAKEGDDKTFDLIEQQLEQQMEVCKSNGELYQKLGNLAASSQHKNLADQCQRDLLAIKGIRSQNLTPPKFTMEMREFAIVHSHPEISDKQIEVEITRGITVPAPSGHSESDMNIYVEVEFPWPQDSPQKFQTKNVKETSNPEFEETCMFDIDRKQGRSLSRVFKRQSVKCSIYQRRTLRKDIFIGMAQVPLEPLETKCDTHVTEDLKDEKGRKAVGGKLEVKIRLREPLSGRDQEVKNQKWLVFQESIATESSVKMLKPQATGGGAGPGGVTSPIKVENTTSLEALRLELQIVQNALKAGKKDPAIIQRGQAIQGRMKLIKQKLQDPGFRREYVLAINRELKAEKILEQQLVQMGRAGEAKVVQGRRKMMENELSKQQSK